MIRVVTVIVETRYGGVYEGGPWAAFAARDPHAVPDDAFSEDGFALDWWDRPTVHVGVGETPDGALLRLDLVLEQDRARSKDGVFAIGESVAIARCAPDDWTGSGVGVVEAIDYRRSHPYRGGARGQCVYAVRFKNGAETRVPERYLRSPPMSLKAST